MIKVPGRGGTAPATYRPGPAPWRRRTAATALALLAVPLAVTALTAVPATAAATTTYGVIGTIKVSGTPWAVGVDTSKHTAYVASEGSGDETRGTVAVIDEATNAVTATIPVGVFPDAVAVDSSGHFAYVTNDYSGTLSVINEATNAVVSTVNVGADPVAVAITEPAPPYVVDGEGAVSEVDPISDSIVTIPVGAGPSAIAMDPSTYALYVANTDDGTVSVIDQNTNTVTATIPIGAQSNPDAVAVDPSTQTVYVANRGDGSAVPGSVSVIDENTNTVTATIPLGVQSYPGGVAVDPSTHTVYVTNGSGVSVIDETTNTVTATVNVGDAPVAVAVDPSTHAAYVANLSGYVSVIGRTTTTAVTSSAGPSVAGQAVTYTATVSPAPDGGTVAFADSGTTISGCGAQPVNTSTGTATCQVSYPGTGTHKITAAYSGYAAYQASTSAALTQTVNPAATTTTVTSSANPSCICNAVTLTITVKAKAPGSGTPTGDISVYINGIFFVPASLTGGKVTLTLPAEYFHTVGTYAITAKYYGDNANNFTASTSAALDQNVVL